MLAIVNQMPLAFKISLGLIAFVLVVSIFLLIMTLREPEDPRDAEEKAVRQQKKIKKKIQKLESKGKNVPEALKNQAEHYSSLLAQQKITQKEEQKKGTGKPKPPKAAGKIKASAQQKKEVVASTAPTPRQVQWVKILVKGELAKMKESQTNIRISDLEALKALVHKIATVPEWESFYDHMDCPAVMGMINRLLLERMMQYAPRAEKWKQMSELLYLMDCVNGGPVPLEGESELLPETVDISESLLQILQLHKDQYQQELVTVSLEAISDASLEIAQTDSVCKLSRGTVRTVARLVIQTLFAEAAAPENRECLVSDESKYFIRILAQLITGKDYELLVQQWKQSSSCA